MSTRRLIGTAAGFAAIAAGLDALTPEVHAMGVAVLHGQRTSDTGGPDALVLAAAGLLAWLVWVWGAIGLALTALAALPGVVGRAAALAQRVVLPAGARRGAALLLGIGLSMGAPVLAAAAPPPAPTPAPAPAPAPAPTDAPTSAADRPTEGLPPAPVVPEWPSAATAGEHLVVPGDCLWDIATDRLQAEHPGRAPAAGEIAVAVDTWWSANADVIGPDPDLIHPGQVLRPPDIP